MAKFDANTLRDLRDLREVTIRTEQHPESAVVIWVVVADDEVFVRSVQGNKGRWYRDLATGGSATLEVFDSPSEELSSLAPREILGGYFRTVGTTFNGGVTLED